MSDSQSKQSKNAANPALSAIVVIPDVYETVRNTVKHLRAQTAASQIEIVIVKPANLI